MQAVTPWRPQPPNLSTSSAAHPTTFYLHSIPPPEDGDGSPGHHPAERAWCCARTPAWCRPISSWPNSAGPATLDAADRCAAARSPTAPTTPPWPSVGDILSASLDGYAGRPRWSARAPAWTPQGTAWARRPCKSRKPPILPPERLPPARQPQAGRFPAGQFARPGKPPATTSGSAGPKPPSRAGRVQTPQHHISRAGRVYSARLVGYAALTRPTFRANSRRCRRPRAPGRKLARPRKGPTRLRTWLSPRRLSPPSTQPAPPEVQPDAPLPGPPAGDPVERHRRACPMPRSPRESTKMLQPIPRQDGPISRIGTAPIQRTGSCLSRRPRPPPRG